MTHAIKTIFSKTVMLEPCELSQALLTRVVCLCGPCGSPFGGHVGGFDIVLE